MVATIIKYLRECALAFLVVSLFVRPVGADPNSAPVQQGIARTARQKLETKITYSCVDLPIETVLMNLAEQAGIDIVKSPKVTGNVTVRVTGVPLEEALANILAAHDCTYVATENMVRVTPIPEVALLREPLVNGIYKITYADANEVAGALRLFISV